ncbi:CLUMA_CG019363, isoform A [Clunio marinus]|uniref:CLUMA_CG019363, isoform A n=1 Tax=Clunio marinus TaxID=568069 RepID=A0A1J1J461_9DIPT|nr:CLUMA_CG019363, isoform A [Clunio marinus]
MSLQFATYFPTVFQVLMKMAEKSNSKCDETRNEKIRKLDTTFKSQCEFELKIDSLNVLRSIHNVLRQRTSFSLIA